MTIDVGRKKPAAVTTAGHFGRAASSVAFGGATLIELDGLGGRSNA
jgi:hypothetical protein